MTLIQTIQERLAKICERTGSLLATRDADYKKLYGHPLEARGIHIIHDAACSRCAAAIRAADLSDLEPKKEATPRCDALKLALRKKYPDPLIGEKKELYYMEAAELFGQESYALERELAALTARLEAAEAEEVRS